VTCNSLLNTGVDPKREVSNKQFSSDSDTSLKYRRLSVSYMTLSWQVVNSLRLWRFQAFQTSSHPVHDQLCCKQWSWGGKLFDEWCILTSSNECSWYVVEWNVCNASRWPDLPTANQAFMMYYCNVSAHGQQNKLIMKIRHYHECNRTWLDFEKNKCTIAISQQS